MIDHRVEDTYPLSPLQQGMLYQYLLDPSSDVNIMQVAGTLYEDLDLQVFKQAWDRVAQRHPLFRTRFRWDGLQEPLQDVLSSVEHPFIERDMRRVPQDQQAAGIRTLLREDRRRSFDLATASLSQVTTCQLEPAKWYFVWTYHHILLDGRTIALVFREVFDQYDALCQGQDLELEPPRLFRDHILALRQIDQSAGEEYWKGRLAGFNTSTPVTVARARSNSDEDDLGFPEEQLKLSEKSTSALRSAAKEHQITLNTMFQGAWAILLSRYRRSTEFSVGIIIPAYNEAECIAECIRSLDDAAVNYSGPCRMYLVDNGSTDDTVAVANQALAECRALRGAVLIAPKKGKAAALNFGISQMTEDVILRVDADTPSTPSLLVQLMPYFSDANVGIVGGMPLPKDMESFYGRMRAIEVYYNIGYSRIAQSAVDSLLCVPGIQTAYRREALEQAGDFSEGVNGEDTDMTVRIGRLGYRVIVDPKIHVYSEAPASWAQLREQRIRWSRSILHVFSRNVSSIGMMQGVRALWLLPNSLWRVFRRVLMVLILVYGLLAVVIDPSVISLRDGAALGAILFGPSGLLTLVTLVIYRKFNLIPFLPGYLFFRLLRAYFSIDMLFSLSLKPIENRRRVPADQDSLSEDNADELISAHGSPRAGWLRSIAQVARRSQTRA